jgi:hypothetical protein
MAPLRWQIIGAALLAALVFVFILDACKAVVFRILKIG